MGAPTTFKTRYLEHLFNNTNHANIGDATGLRGSTTASNFWIGLHYGTADDNSVANELDYTGYGRVSAVRSASGWTISGTNVSNASLVTFGKKTAGTDRTATHFKVYTAVTGGDCIITGNLTSSLLVSDNVTPEFAIGDLDVNFT